MAYAKKHKIAENQPLIIDLFAGVGGFSLGAARAGFDIIAAVDTDPIAAEIHAKNFRQVVHIPLTVRTLTGKDLLSYSGLKGGQLDGLIGGPPCQGFSSMGHRDTTDKRNDLFSHFFRLVNETRPKFFLAENVPGILSSEYDHVRIRAIDLVHRHYEVLDPIIVTATDYGVPTTRTRIFFIGFRKTADLAPTIVLKPKIEKVRVRDALKGLPLKINEDWQCEEDGWRRRGSPQLTTFLRKAIGNLPENVGDPDAVERFFERNQVSGCLGTVHEREVVARFRNLQPGQKDSVSKAVRLDPDGFCPTLRAGTGSDRGSYQAVRPIHHREPRVITPREAARLQGFPDWFVFHPTKWHSFRQIGNSVSPIVAEHLLRRICRTLTQTSISPNTG